MGIQAGQRRWSSGGAQMPLRLACLVCAWHFISAMSCPIVHLPRTQQQSSSMIIEWSIHPVFEYARLFHQHPASDET